MGEEGDFVKVKFKLPGRARRAYVFASTGSIWEGVIVPFWVLERVGLARVDDRVGGLMWVHKGIFDRLFKLIVYAGGRSIEARVTDVHDRLVAVLSADQGEALRARVDEYAELWRRAFSVARPWVGVGDLVTTEYKYRDIIRRTAILGPLSVVATYNPRTHVVVVNVAAPHEGRAAVELLIGKLFSMGYAVQSKHRASAVLYATRDVDGYENDWQNIVKSLRRDIAPVLEEAVASHYTRIYEEKARLIADARSRLGINRPPSEPIRPSDVWGIFNVHTVKSNVYYLVVVDMPNDRLVEVAAKHLEENGVPSRRLSYFKRWRERILEGAHEALKVIGVKVGEHTYLVPPQSSDLLARLSEILHTEITEYFMLLKTVLLNEKNVDRGRLWEIRKYMNKLREENREKYLKLINVMNKILNRKKPLYLKFNPITIIPIHNCSLLFLKTSHIRRLQPSLYNVIGRVGVARKVDSDGDRRRVFDEVVGKYFPRRL